MLIILLTYLLFQFLLYTLVQDTWIFALNALPILFSAILLGMWPPVLTGIIIHLANFGVIRAYGHQSPASMTFGIIFNLSFILIGMGIGRISELARKANLSEAAMYKAKKEAEEANRVKSEFIANISHEIRTPMNSIIGYTEVLKEKITDPDQSENIEIILKAGNTLLNLINDLLDFSKIEAGRLELFKQEFSFNQIFTLLSDLFSLKTRKKKINYSYEIDASVPPVLYGDDKKIQQILINIIGNAFKFTENGEIRVTCSYNDGYVCIHIKDTGIGIPEEMQENIFTSFFQGHNALSYSGTGLGLTISRKLVELMEGDLVLESSPGHGSTFIIRLPLREIRRNPEKPILENSEQNQEQKDLYNKNNMEPGNNKPHIKNKQTIDSGPIRLLIKKLKTSCDIFNPAELEEDLEYIAEKIPLELKYSVMTKIKAAITRFDDELLLDVIKDLEDYVGD